MDSFNSPFISFYGLSQKKYTKKDLEKLTDEQIFEEAKFGNLSILLDPRVTEIRNYVGEKIKLEKINGKWMEVKKPFANWTPFDFLCVLYKDIYGFSKNYMRLLLKMVRSK